jgi:hypothetical protein
MSRKSRAVASAIMKPLRLLFVGRAERKSVCENPNFYEEIQENIRYEMSAFPIQQL